MGLSNPDPAFDDQVTDFQRMLEKLTEKYLVTGLNSNISIHFIEIDPPELSDLEYRVDDLEKGVRSFLSETLNNGPEYLFPAPFPPFRRGLLLKDDDAPIVFETDKMLTKTLTEEELAKVFAGPILQTFLTLKSSVYTVTRAGRIKYESLLELIWCCSILAVSVKDRWFILVGEWTD